MIQQITGEIAIATMRDALVRGETIGIPSLGVEVSLTDEQTDLLDAMKLKRWYFTLVEFADVLDPLVELGIIAKMPNPAIPGWAYMRVV